MKKYLMMWLMMLCMPASWAFDQGGITPEGESPEFLDGFLSFGGLVAIIVPLVVGFIASKLKKPMNRWVTMWVTALVSVAVTFFSWWMDLGFPPHEASVWIVMADALFVALASTGIISDVTSEWLAKLFGNKIEQK